MCRGQQFVADLAVAIHAGLGALVGMIREVPFVELLSFVGTAACRAAVKNIDNAVAINILIRNIADAILVKVPATDAVRAV